MKITMSHYSPQILEVHGINTPQNFICLLRLLKSDYIRGLWLKEGCGM